MKLHFCIFLTLVVGSLSVITTEYKYLQEYGNFPVLDILQCQLRANGNTSCAIRFNTTTTNGVIEEQERCEQLSVDWCYTGVLESGFTYAGKSVVSLTPPFTFYEWPGPTREIWEQIPIAIKKGAKVTVKFTAPVGAGTQVLMRFFNAAEASKCIYEQFLYPNIPQVSAGVKATVTAEFEDTEIRLNVEGQMYLSGYIRYQSGGYQNTSVCVFLQPRRHPPGVVQSCYFVIPSLTKPSGTRYMHGQYI